MNNWWSNSLYTREFSFPSLLFSPQPHQRKRSPFRTTSINLENGNLRNLSGGNPLQRRETRPWYPSADYHLYVWNVSRRTSLKTERLLSQQLLCCRSTIQESEDPPSQRTRQACNVPGHNRKQFDHEILSQTSKRRDSLNSMDTARIWSDEPK